MIKKIAVVSLVVVLCLFMSCNKEKEMDAKAYYDVVNLSDKIDDNLINTFKFEIDTLTIQSSIETSYVGDLLLFNDTLFFADEFFGYLFRFTKDGELIDRHIGKGRGPNEVIGYNYSAVSDKFYCFLNGGNSGLAFFNKKFIKEKEYRIDWEIKRSKKEVLANPIPKVGDSYEFDFGMPGIFKVWNDKQVSIAITASHPKFNGYFNSELYYNHSRILAIINRNTGKIDKLIGRRPPIYLLHKNIPNFDHFNYEVTNENVFVNFWADSTIYVTDKKTDLAIGKFGHPGKNMNTNYPTTQSYEDAENNWREDRNNFGHYHYIKYIPTENIMYRGYTKGKGETTDGLQIYRGYNMVGDISVPKGLKVIGEINGEIYAINSNDENMLIIYKIKLNDEN